MNVVKQFLVYIIGGVLIALAVGFHFALTRGITAQFESKLKAQQTLRDRQKVYVNSPKDIYNDASIAEAKKGSDRMTEQINESERYLARQPRRAHTRRFQENELLGTGPEIKENVTWRRIYGEQTALLRQQVTDAGFNAFSVQASTAWGSGVPTDDEITAAMELFWRQKDMADFFTDQVEKDLTEYMSDPTRAIAFPAKPADLVISRNYARLDEQLRDEKKEDLIKVFQAIIFNPKQQDLAAIFDENLPTFPWSKVLTITMDDAQSRYLDDLVPTGKEDLANRQRFRDFVMELRLVRYRSDVIGLLDSRPRLDDVASMLRKGTEEERARLDEEMRNQNQTWLAQAIAGIVCLRNEKDYNLVRSNHSPRVAELRSLTMGTGNVGATEAASGMAGGDMGGRPGGMPSPYGGRPGPREGGSGGGKGSPEAAATSGNDLYVTYPFSMSVKIEFDRIPVFLRRLMNSSWRYRVEVLKVLPASSTTQTGEGMSAGRGAMSGGMPPGMTHGAPGPGFGPGFTAPATAPKPQVAPVVPTEGTAESVEVRNYVWLDISGEAYQFSPIRAKLDAKAKEAANAARSAAP